MSIDKAIKVVKELMEYLEKILVNETNVTALSTILAELDKKDKIIDLMADAIYGDFYSFKLNSGKKVKKYFEYLAKEK